MWYVSSYYVKWWKLGTEIMTVCYTGCFGPMLCYFRPSIQTHGANVLRVQLPRPLRKKTRWPDIFSNFRHESKAEELTKLTELTAPSRRRMLLLRLNRSSCCAVSHVARSHGALMIINRQFYQTRVFTVSPWRHRKSAVVVSIVDVIQYLYKTPLRCTVKVDAKCCSCLV